MCNNTCTMNAAKQVGWPHKLKELCNHLSISLEHHDSLSDADACAQIAIRLHKEGKSNVLLYRSMSSYNSSIDLRQSIIDDVIVPGNSQHKAYENWETRQVEIKKKILDEQIEAIKKTSTKIDTSKSRAELELELIRIRPKVSRLKQKLIAEPGHSKTPIWQAQFEHFSELKENYQTYLNKNS